MAFIYFWHLFPTCKWLRSHKHSGIFMKHKRYVYVSSIGFYNKNRTCLMIWSEIKLSIWGRICNKIKKKRHLQNSIKIHEVIVELQYLNMVFKLIYVIGTGNVISEDRNVEGPSKLTASLSCTAFLSPWHTSTAFTLLQTQHHSVYKSLCSSLPLWTGPKYTLNLPFGLQFNLVTIW